MKYYVNFISGKELTVEAITMVCGDSLIMFYDADNLLLCVVNKQEILFVENATCREIY